VITHVFNRNGAEEEQHARATFVPWECGVDRARGGCAPRADVDVVVELMGGLDPAEGWLRAALSAGKHVVTANKQLIAYRGAELFALAASKGVQLLYGAAVAGGVPVIPGIAQGLSGDVITRISGIVNGTCNFILSSMESGADYGEVLKKAQAAGYAEAIRRRMWMASMRGRSCACWRGWRCMRRSIRRRCRRRRFDDLGDGLCLCEGVGMHGAAGGAKLRWRAG
jgi:homoserine dehydrogenase